jgi:stearoyl-CoA desaturase (delta-9 desaturase)
VVLVQLLVALLVGFAVSQVATLATTVWLHRSLAHRALTVRSPLTWLFRVVVWLTTGMKPREWVAVHRKHHAFTDSEQDPHSPAQAGVLRVQFANAAMYRRVARDPETIARYAKDLQPDAWDRVLFDRAWLGLGLGVTVLIVVLGPLYGTIAAVFHLAYYLWMSGAVNALAHHFGRRPYANSATNLQWLAFLSGGEGLHNNHHAAPTSARFSLHRGEIDLGWIAIRAFRALGQVRVRLEQVKLTAAAASGGASAERSTAA